MNPKWKQFYLLMLAEIVYCHEIEKTEIGENACCHQVALAYWTKIKMLFLNTRCTEAEEIAFFRNVKPQFTSYIEYSLIINRGLLLAPNVASKMIDYWKEEEMRYEQFREKNDTFIKYYESGNDEFNKTHFLREKDKETELPQITVYNDLDCRSLSDHIVRSLIAHKMYREFARKKISERTFL